MANGREKRVEYLDHETDAEEEKEAVVVATMKGANEATSRYRGLGGKKGKEKKKRETPGRGRTGRGRVRDLSVHPRKRKRADLRGRTGCLELAVTRRVYVACSASLWDARS